jgi:hypothetical protein
VTAGRQPSAAYHRCRGWQGVNPQPPIQCPPSITYPLPPSYVGILFVGWNPPGLQHFWDGPGDDLHDNLAWVFRELGWSSGPDFLADFLAHRCYLVHAVKCWRDPSWPSVDATRRCAPLMAADISQLRPQTICLLGRRPHLAATSPIAAGSAEPVIRGLPRVANTFRYGRGWCGIAGGTNVIITAFANRRWNRAEEQENRQCVVDALRRWANPPSPL